MRLTHEQVQIRVYLNIPNIEISFSGSWMNLDQQYVISKPCELKHHCIIFPTPVC